MLHDMLSVSSIWFPSMGSCSAADVGLKSPKISNEWDTCQLILLHIYSSSFFWNKSVYAVCCRAGSVQRIFTDCSLNCLLQLKTAQWEWTPTVKLCTRQLNNELIIKLRKTVGELQMQVIIVFTTSHFYVVTLFSHCYYKITNYCCFKY